MSPRVLTARGHHSGKASTDWNGGVISRDNDPEPAPEPAECEHLVCEPRVRTLSNNEVRYVVQCLECGKQVGTIKKNDWNGRDRIARSNPPWDPSIGDAYYTRRQEEWREWHARKNEVWWGQYSAYMASPAWWSRRCQRLELDAYQCQALLQGCTHHAEQVHHLTYAHLGNEPLFELISVCASCHDAITAMDRKKRGAV